MFHLHADQPSGRVHTACRLKQWVQITGHAALGGEIKDLGWPLPHRRRQGGRGQMRDMASPPKT